VVVARTAIPAGRVVRPADVTVREIPARFAPGGALASTADLEGLRAAVAIPAGAAVTAGQIGDGISEQEPGAPVRPGERIAEIVASGSPELVQPGGRVDVLVTTEGEGDRPGATVLALEDVEVLAAAPAGEAGVAQDGTGGGGTDPGAAGAPDIAAAGAQRVQASLRVTLRQAVYLAAAQSFARDLRLLSRAPGDRRGGAAGLRVGSGLD
jgi:pilus assembly protein CpaB